MPAFHILRWLERAIDHFAKVREPRALDRESVSATRLFHEQEPADSDLESGLLASLSDGSFLGLLSRLDRSSRKYPVGTVARNMFRQQNSWPSKQDYLRAHRLLASDRLPAFSLEIHQ
jgi:hypothetical protein